MSFFDYLRKTLTQDDALSYEKQKSLQIRCALCNSTDLLRDGRESIVCRACGKQYSLDEARKTMGTANCLDCIFHNVDQYNDGITERCFHWDYTCRSICDKKQTKPSRRWTDAARWEKE